MRKRILFRVNGGDIRETGLGHIIRDLRLASELQARSKADVCFLMQGSDEAAKLVTDNGYILHRLMSSEEELPVTLRLLSDWKPDVFVIDILQVNPTYLSSVRQTGVMVTALDLSGPAADEADFVINALLPTGQSPYEGLDYIVLPDSQLAPPRPQNQVGTHNVFVSFGGFDAGNLTRRFVDSLPPAQTGLRYHVAVSRLYREVDALRARSTTRTDLQIYQDPPDFGSILSGSDLAVVAGGMTMFQAVSEGVPALVVAQYEHQIENAKRFHADGSVEYLGLAEGVDFQSIHDKVRSWSQDPNRLQLMKRAGSRTLDVLGHRRVSELISVIDFLEWDSAFFGVRIAALYPRRLRERIVRFAMDKCREDRIDCLYYLCDCHDPESVRLAEAHGFHFVDIRLQFLFDLEKYSAPNPQQNQTPQAAQIRTAEASDIPALVRIAEDSYVHSRYYFDHRFPEESCRRFYGDWITKSVKGEFDDEVLVADIDGLIAGYVSVLKASRSRGRIGLIGIAPTHQNKGIGKQLVSRALQWFKQNDLPLAEVVTQGRNLAAQRLYQSSGFQIERTELWYHKWFSTPS